MSGNVRAARIAGAFAFAAAVLTWNATFERGIVLASNRYLAAQRAHKEGHGPFVYVQDFMRPAVGASARRATVWTAPVAIIGLAVVRFVSRYQRM
jgi:hypothetical protein